MQKIPEYLKMHRDEDDIKDWCLVRYLNDGHRCGPLSLNEEALGNLGFPNGGIGPSVLTFDTEAEARDFLDDCPGLPGGANDVPELVSKQTLAIESLDCWNGKATILWRGSDLLEMRSVFLAAVGRNKMAGYNHRVSIIVAPTEEGPK